MNMLLRTDGTCQPLPRECTVHEAQKLIGAAALYTVQLAQYVPPRVMLVNRAALAGQLPLNRIATVLYLHNTRPGIAELIRGDVVILEGAAHARDGQPGA